MLDYWTDTEQELPNNQVTDSWGINMTGNILLMHIEDYADKTKLIEGKQKF